MATPEDHVKLAAFLLEHDYEDEAKKVLAALIAAPEEKAPKEASKPYLYLDPDIGARMHSWHKGQGDPVYQVGSLAHAGKKVMRRHLQEAIDGLEADYEFLKKKMHQAAKRELEGLIDELNGYLSGDIEDYSYAFEG